LSISDLTKPIYKNQLAIAPTNASFQAFVTAMINSNGIDFSRNWLAAIKANGVKIYAKNAAIVEAIDKGEVSIGLVNHYYTWEVSESLGREINVLNGFFAAGDIGNLINVSGIGVLKSSDKVDLAKGLIDFLASTETQKKFVSDTHEYSLIDNQSAPTGLPTLAEIGSPNVDLGLLKDVKTTQDLLIEVGLL
jgi:iron(III) transport system substrate-binding protein